MKFFKKSSTKHLTIFVDSTEIHCCMFIQEDEKKPFFILSSYSSFKFENLEILELNIFNFQKIEDFINSFLFQNNLKNPFTYISLSGNLIKQLILKSSELEKVTDLIDVNLHAFDIDEITSSKEKNKYLITAIPYWVIFQYCILVMNCGLNLLCLSTLTSTIISTCKFIKSDIFSTIEPNKIDEFQGCFEKIINDCDINSYFGFSNFGNLTDDFLFKNLGLLFLENKTIKMS